MRDAPMVVDHSREAHQGKCMYKKDKAATTSDMILVCVVVKRVISLIRGLVGTRRIDVMVRVSQTQREERCCMWTAHKLMAADWKRRLT
jgi:hypothetical protein